MKSDGKPMNIARASSGLEPAMEDHTARALESLHGARGMTRTQTRYQTAIAVQVPRDIEVIERRCLKESALMGRDYFYQWTVNNKDGTKGIIEGTSIDGAMMLIRNFGNCVAMPALIDETPSHWLLNATFIDLETGFTTERLYRGRKSERHGKYDDERALDIAFQISQSKAIRNVVINAMPGWLVNRALEIAKGAAVANYEKDLPGSIARCRAGFARMKVTDAMLERYVGKAIADWLPTDLSLLSAVFKAIAERQTTVGREFGDDPIPDAETPEATPPPPATTSATPPPPKEWGGATAPSAAAATPPPATPNSGPAAPTPPPAISQAVATPPPATTSAIPTHSKKHQREPGDD